MRKGCFVKVKKYLLHGLIWLAAGLACRTLLFVCLFRLFFHSYDCATDEYRNYFQFGTHVCSVGSVIWVFDFIPLLFVVAGLILTRRNLQSKPLSKWIWAVAILVGIGAELAFWLVRFLLAMAIHFTTGDVSVFSPGVC